MKDIEPKPKITNVFSRDKFYQALESARMEGLGVESGGNKTAVIRFGDNVHSIIRLVETGYTRLPKISQIENESR